MKRYFKQIVLVALAAFMLNGCAKLLDQKPQDTGSNVLPDIAIRTGKDLKELLNSAYDVLANTYNGVYQNLPTLMSDNLERPVNQDNYTSVWLRRSTIFNGSVGEGYKQLYIAILRANTVIENIDRVSEISAEDQIKYKAEAHFIRALCHLDAVRGWAHPYGYTPSNSHPGVAIKNSTEVKNTERSSVAEVYNFILNDLAVAKAGLPENNGVYATYWAALALEAEVKFQQHDYSAAYQLADEAITQGPAVFDTEVNKYQFPDASPEAYFYIFSAQRQDGNVDSRISGFKDNYYNGGDPKLYIPKELYEKFTIHGDTSTARGKLVDVREQDGNISYFTRMFDDEYFNIPVLSYTQMLLIRAESAAQIGGDLTQAIQDINTIKERAYGSIIDNLINSASANEVIQAARLERRLEFPFNGQRFHDLKRMGSQGENIIVRDAPWDCEGMILQFPAVEGTDLFPLNPGGGC